jgi:hypothetical protein
MTKNNKNKLEYDLIGYIRFPKPKPTLFRKIINKLYQKPRNPEKVGWAVTGKMCNGPKKISEKFSNFLEKNLIILISVFIFSILILNIFLTLILVIKYL